MSVAKGIATGLIVIGLVSIAFLGATHVYLNEIGPIGSEVENVQENSSGPAQENATNQQTASWWDEHDLHAVPGLENAIAENLPTAEEVENILFNWSGFESKLGAVFFDRIGSLEEVLYNDVKPHNLEYHYDEEGVLHIDTPGVVFETPSERDDNQYYISNFNVVVDGYGDVVRSLNFCRYLDNLEITCGIAGFVTDLSNYPELFTDNTGIQGVVVVPVKRGLAYFYPVGGEHGTSWSGNYVVLNPKPGNQSPWTSYEDRKTIEIRLHWRLGEGDYVSWLYKLENGEPAMTWLDNGEPVDW